jgi:hypothetical protein
MQWNSDDFKVAEHATEIHEHINTQRTEVI